MSTNRPQQQDSTYETRGTKTARVSGAKNSPIAPGNDICAVAIVHLSIQNSATTDNGDLHKLQFLKLAK